LSVFRSFAPVVLAPSLAWLYFEFQYGKLGTHLFLNGFRADGADAFFRLMTRGGEAVAIVPVFVLLAVFVSWRSALAVGLSSILVLIAVGILKQLIFPDSLRPTGLIDSEALHLVEGVNMHKNHSFPSGHTMAAYAWTLSALFFLRAPLFSVLLPLMALAIGLSRIYLSQHFLVDVAAGAWLGSLIGWGTTRWVSGWSAAWLDRKIRAMST
jgi:membrane-associated phospholipid phosphatase